jgi:DNA-binding NarL/FixJ family response regulator
LADDYEVIREGVRLILEREGDIQVVAQAGDADEAYRLCAALEPDVLLLDANMPGASGLAAIPGIRQASGKTAIVMLSMARDSAVVARAFEQGATGFVAKDSAADDVVEALRAAVAGERFTSPSLI